MSVAPERPERAADRRAMDKRELVEARLAAFSDLEG